LTDKARPILARILDLSNEIRTEAFAGMSPQEGRQLIELLRRVHANLSERVSALAAELADLDEPDDGLMVRAPSTQADLSPVGGGL
jgi:hypothetical protein